MIVLMIVVGVIVAAAVFGLWFAHGGPVTRLDEELAAVDVELDARPVPPVRDIRRAS